MPRLRRLIERAAAGITPTRTDTVLAVGLVAVVALQVAFDPTRPRPWPVAVVAGVLASAAVAWRRRLPVQASLGACAILATSSVVGLLVHGQDAVNRSGELAAVGSLVLAYSVVRYAEGAWRAIGLGAWIDLTVIDALATERGIAYTNILSSAVLWALVGASAVAFAYRADLRAQRDEQARTGEREQLARELHDVVAHHVSAMVVQASAALAVLDRQPDQARPALQFIKTSGQETMGEMRRMVGILRGAEDAELAPRRGIAGLADLFTEQPGPIPVHLRVVGTPVPVDGPVDQSVHRLAQESVTNARRHGRATTAIDVLLRWAPGQLVLEVTNDGAPALEPGNAEGGFGLVGMAERARLLGGTFEAGPRPGGGWRVVARLPIDPTTPAATGTGTGEAAPAVERGPAGSVDDPTAPTPPSEEDPS